MSQTCVEILREGIARGMDDAELLGLFDQVRTVRNKLRGTLADVGDFGRAVREGVAEAGDRVIMEAAAKKRALALQSAARLKAVDYVLTNFSGKEYDGLSSLLVGSNILKSGTRMSVDAQQVSLSGYYAGGLLADVRALGETHLALLTEGVMDKDIARALFALDNPEAKPFRGAKEAADVAGVIHKWQEKARSDANLSGAWVGRLPGYIVRQSHNRAKIRSAGFEEWRAFLEKGGRDKKPLLDWSRIQDGTLKTPEQRKNFLQAVYTHITMGRENRRQETSLGGPRPGSVGSAAARVSHERVLHFTDADAWAAYNRAFGVGNLREAVLHGLMSSAQNTALMRTLGPSPQRNFDLIFHDVRSAAYARGDREAVDTLDSMRKRLGNQLKEVDGTLNHEGHPGMAAVGRFVRTWTNMTKLGKVLLSSFSDMPLFGGEFSYQGKSFLGSMLEGIVGLVHGRGSAEQQRILSQIGLFFDGMAADVTARFSGDELPGRMTRMQNMFFKLSGLQWWTDAWRKNAGLMMAHGLALERNLDWNGLSRERRRLFGLYGIDAAQWDLLRQGGTREADGRDYFTPDAVDDLGDGLLAEYLLRHGQETTPHALANLRMDLQTRLRTMFRDRIDFAVLTPDAKTRSFTRFGTAAGTVEGEALRYVMQFKSFPIAVMQKVWGRETIGRADEGKGAAFMNFARMFLLTTLFGYGSMTAKELLAGKNPRKIENAEDFRKTFLAAAAQGGGLGIYGDFLFGEVNRMGGGPTATLLGPAYGTVVNLADIYTRVRDGDSAAQAALRFAINNTPGSNLWWFRTGFDYAIGYQMFEMMKPGFFARTRRRVKRENNQTFWMRPRGV